MMIKDRFETTDTGRGSKAHKEHLRREIKKGLKKIGLQKIEKKILDKLKKMSLKEINDRAETLLEQVEKEGLTDDISLEMTIIRDVLTGIIQSKKAINDKEIDDIEKEEEDFNTPDDMIEPPLGTTRSRGYRGHRHG